MSASQAERTPSASEAVPAEASSVKEAALDGALNASP
jgi:hypothetical protein